MNKEKAIKKAKDEAPAKMKEGAGKMKEGAAKGHKNGPAKGHKNGPAKGHKDGPGKMKHGASKMKDGAGKMKDGAGKLPKGHPKGTGRGASKMEDGAGKMPDGFNMRRPAEKLGYIQKLGAGRMSPGKMGDMTAMKMMHGDAAAKYYDGAGMYMNGAPKYEGASKSYMGPMTPGHGGAPGHIHGDDRPSYTKQTTTTKVTPGTNSSTETSSSGGSTSSTANYDKLMANKKDLGPDFKPTKEQTAKANEEVRIAREKDRKANESKSSTKKTTKPTVETKVEKKKVTSKRKSGAQVMSEGRETEMNRANRQKAGMQEMLNIAKKDSANVAQGYLKNKQVTPKTLTRAVKLGNQAGRKTLRGYGDDKGSFGQQGHGHTAEFRYSQENTDKAFPNIGQATATTISRGKTKDGRKFAPGQEFKTQSYSYNEGDIGRVKGFSKKGQYKITDVATDPGTAGSFGGYSSAKEYMDAMGLSAGSPKLPSGPMKFGMRK